jgi:hypothetical protein
VYVNIILHLVLDPAYTSAPVFSAS